MTKDIRWEQRFLNFRKAWKKLQVALLLIEEISMNPAGLSQAGLNEILSEGIIQRFEYTHELAWNVMKDYAAYQGNFEIRGSRDATREAFKMGLIESANEWMDMLQSRNLTTHTYNEDIADEILDQIKENYQFRFLEFERKMTELVGR